MLNLGFCFFVFGTRQKRSSRARCWVTKLWCSLLGTFDTNVNNTTLARESRALDVVIVSSFSTLSLSLSLFFLFYQKEIA